MQFKTGEIEDVVVRKLVKNVDERGFLIETFRLDTLPEGVVPRMSYISYTEPGVGRGPHEHESQNDLFAFIGPGNFKVYLWDNRKTSSTFGNKKIVFAGEDNPLCVIVPAGVVHAYKNISKTVRGMVLNYPDALYRGQGKNQPVDEIRHEERGDEFFEDFVK